MRKPTAILLGACLAGALVVVILAARSERREAFTLGVTPAVGVVNLKAGAQLCQGPIRIPDAAAEFDRVAVALGTFHQRGPAIALTVEPVGGGRALGGGRLAPGYDDIARTPTHSVPVGHVDTREPFQLCLRNAGSKTVAIYGNADPSSRTSSASLEGQPANADIYLSFERAQPRSSLSHLGTILDRAALWRTPWVGAWLFIAVALVVLLVVPTLLVRALRGAQG